MAINLTQLYQIASTRNFHHSGVLYNLVSNFWWKSQDHYLSSLKIRICIPIKSSKLFQLLADCSKKYSFGKFGNQISLSIFTVNYKLLLNKILKNFCRSDLLLEYFLIITITNWMYFHKLFLIICLNPPLLFAHSKLNEKIF